jgi:Zn-finger nucleic acid-binding protein
MLLSGLELSRCLLCGSTGFPGTQCDSCIVPRPAFDDAIVAAKCPRCTTPLEIMQVGPGSGAPIFACKGCRWTFLPPRAWSLALGDARVVAEIEERVPLPSIRVEDALPMMRCPSCSQPMDRARFAATSASVIDVCRYQHGVWVDAGALHKILMYEPSRDEDRRPVHEHRPEIAQDVLRQDLPRLEKVHAATRGVPRTNGLLLVLILGLAFILAGLHYMGGCRGLDPRPQLNE